MDPRARDEPVGFVEPPRYPTIPHLRSHVSVGKDDVVLDDREASDWLHADVLVEEKLDGANICLWHDDGKIKVSGRSRDGARDRGNQLGRLRAWAAERSGQLIVALGPGQALYGEWLWRQHSVHYDALPDYLVGIDVWDRDEGFASVEDRDALLARAGIVRPPVLFEGRMERSAVLDHLLRSRSRFSGQPLEGLVIRRQDARHELVKVVSPHFRRLDDSDWAGGRPLNNLDGQRT